MYRPHTDHDLLDAEARKLLALLPEHQNYLRKYGPAYEDPDWIKELKQSQEKVEFAGNAGADKLDAWQHQTEKEIENLLRRRPWGLLHILGLLRRLPQDLYFLGETEEVGGVRSSDPYLANIAELAAMKYAEWDREGTMVEPWQPEPIGVFAYDRPSLNDTKLAEVVGLSEIGGSGLAHLYNMGKTVARGGEVSINSRGEADSRQEPVLERRLDLYGQRNSKFSLLGSTAGTFYSSSVQGNTSARTVAAVNRTRYREDEGQEEWIYRTLGGALPKWDKRFMFYPIDLRGAYEYLKLLEREASVQYGLTPELIVASLMAIGRVVLRFLCPDSRPEGMSRERLVFLDRRGYILVHEQVMDTGVLGSWALQIFEQTFPNAAHEGDPQHFAHDFKRLAYLDSYQRQDLSMKDGVLLVTHPGGEALVAMPMPFIYPAGDYRIIDLNGVSRFVNGLFENLVLEEQPRQRVAGDLEDRLGGYLDEQLEHPQAFPIGKELKYKPPNGPSRAIAELDVSLKIGAVLVVIDAKSIRVSSGCRRYEHSALQTRWQKFEKYVEKADKQAEVLASHPQGTNYDLVGEGYTHVVTLLCSAKPEYIDSDEDRFYIRDDLPRVATPLELREYLGDVTEELLKSLPFAKEIVDP